MIRSSAEEPAAVHSNTRWPLKNGYFDHGQYCVEYIALMCGSGTRLKAALRKEPSPAVPPDPLGWMAV
jgi:hypothetical protein